MTHDINRVLLGVKQNVTNCAVSSYLTFLFLDMLCSFYMFSASVMKNKDLSLISVEPGYISHCLVTCCINQ